MHRLSQLLADTNASRGEIHVLLIGFFKRNFVVKTFAIWGFQKKSAKSASPKMPATILFMILQPLQLFLIKFKFEQEICLGVICYLTILLMA